MESRRGRGEVGRRYLRRYVEAHRIGRKEVWLEPQESPTELVQRMLDKEWFGALLRSKPWRGNQAKLLEYSLQGVDKGERLSASKARLVTEGSETQHLVW